MSSDVVVAVVEDTDDVRNAFARNVPLVDLLEHDCIGCGKTMFLTRKQYDAYNRDVGEKTLVFQCMKCYVAKVKAKRAREDRERN